MHDSMFPRSYQSGLRLVNDGNQPGFDELDVRLKLGDERADRLYAQVAAHSSVFVCNHRLYPSDYPEELKRGTEVHCFYAIDVEKFLETEGA